MQRILSTDLPTRAGEPVRLAGWVHRRRLLKSVAFLILRDAAGLAQVVVTEPATRAALATLTEESVVTVAGTVRANPAAPGGVEVVDPSVEALTDPAQAPPFDLYRPTLTAALPTALDCAYLALRHPRRRAVHEVSAAAVAGFRSALAEWRFVEVHTPKIVASATESGADVFGVDYFGRPAYLAQSPQFYKQMLVGVFERVYEVGPVFRAEPHDTVRHLAQYTSLDAELGFIEDHRDVMAVARDAVAGMLEAVAAQAGAALRLLGLALPEVPARIPEIRFPDALRLVGAEPDEPDLAPAHERALGEWARQEHGSELLFVTAYPMVKRPFYTHPEPGRPDLSRSFDLLFRGVELATGGQRRHRYGDYVAALAQRGEHDLAPYAGYLDTFRYGMPPHGGFAIGLERFVARLVGAANVREVTLFPRDLNRLTP
ncbi:MAG TPA: aspartate--tRNA(Asn) ligase [Micromonosporaceae bacterium]|nr:aspartate--tRNA(Asn) ligase [Micromonosporaceae bacterium]